MNARRQPPAKPGNTSPGDPPQGLDLTQPEGSGLVSLFGWAQRMSRAIDMLWQAVVDAYDSAPGLHEQSHLAGGTDPFPAQAPVSLVLNDPNKTGVGPSYSRGDHEHALDLLLTTKGDLLTRNGTIYVRLPAGSDGSVLTADSTQAAGLKYSDLSLDDVTMLALIGLGG